MQRRRQQKLRSLDASPRLRSAEDFVAMMNEKFDGSNYPKRLDDIQ